MVANAKKQQSSLEFEKVTKNTRLIDHVYHRPQCLTVHKCNLLQQNEPLTER
jgi:hypothetical protein